MLEALPASGNEDAKPLFGPKIIRGHPMMTHAAVHEVTATEIDSGVPNFAPFVFPEIESIACLEIF